MAKMEKGAKKPEKLDPEVQAIVGRKQLESLVAVRAAQDADFRRKLIADPKGTLQKMVAFDLGAVKFVVHEETIETVHISVPPLIAKAKDGELSDSDLASVAGGRGKAPPWNPKFGGGAATGGSCSGDCLQATVELGMGLVGCSWLWGWESR